MKKVNTVGIGGSGMSYHRHDVVVATFKAVNKIEKSFKRTEQIIKFTEKSDKAFFRGLKHNSK